MERLCDHALSGFFVPDWYPGDLGIANYRMFLKKMGSWMGDKVFTCDTLS